MRPCLFSPGDAGHLVTQQPLSSDTSLSEAFCLLPGREDGTGRLPPGVSVGQYVADAKWTGCGRALPGVRAGREVPRTGPCELDTAASVTVTGSCVWSLSLAPRSWQTGLHGHEGEAGSSQCPPHFLGDLCVPCDLISQLRGTGRAGWPRPWRDTWTSRGAAQQSRRLLPRGNVCARPFRCCPQMGLWASGRKPTGPSPRLRDWFHVVTSRGLIFLANPVSLCSWLCFIH